MIYSFKFFFWLFKDSEKKFYCLVTGPRVLAIIKLDEGPQMTSQVICDPKEAKIGMRVKSVFRRIATDGESGIIHYGTKFVPVE